MATADAIEATSPAAETFEQLKPRLIELLTNMHRDERLLALDGPFADIDARTTRISLGDAEPAVAIAADRANQAKLQNRRPKAKSPRPKTTDALTEHLPGVVGGKDRVTCGKLGFARNAEPAVTAESDPE
jgi:hypothetical protein